MATYNDSYELYHFGVRGMKWGIRRYQNKNGSLTPQGRNRYSQRDEFMFGKKGAERIAKRQESGKSRKYAVNVERAQQIVKGVLLSGALSTTSFLISSGKGKELISKGTKAVKDLWNSRFDSMVLDASGKVIGKYKNSVKDIVTDLVTRR